MINPTAFTDLFTAEQLDALFPADRADRFFEALYADKAEGAYDIRLRYQEGTAQGLTFHFRLERRARKCLACNLTYGLPQVFRRHPVIDLKAVVAAIHALLGARAEVTDFTLGATRELSPDLHVIPLHLTLAPPPAGA